MTNRIVLAYTAGPFTGKSRWQEAENIRAAERVGIEVARAGAMPVIPHANTANYSGECSPEFWYAGTLQLMRACDCVVLTPDWQRSTGAKAEYAEATRLGMPVFTMPDMPLSEHNREALAAFLAGVRDEVAIRG